MKWTVGTKIAGGYALALLVLLVLGLLSYRNTRGLIEGADMKAHTFEVLGRLGGLISALQNAETGQRGYLLVGEESYLQPYNEGIASASQILQDLRTLTSDDPLQQNRLAVLEPLVADKMAELKETVDLRSSKGLDAAMQIVRTNRGKAEMDDIRKIVSDMRAEEDRLLKSRNEIENDGAKSTMAVILYGVPLAFVLVVLVGYAITKSISSELAGSISQLSSMSSQILATTSQAAAGAAETATAVSQTTATVEEVKQTAQLASHKARNVSESAQKAAQISVAGRKSAEDSIRVMQQIQEKMESIAERVVLLSEQGLAIGEIIVSVNDLAEQSGILAVNAAIEANKAGEYGKGFSVVAQEIRNLAEQSKQATAQVRAILGEIQKSTSAAVLAAEQGAKTVEIGVSQSSEAGESIRLLAESIAEAAQSSIQIAASSQQQMVGMDQVALAMESIKEASQQNAAGTKQAEAAAHDLHQIGRHLGGMIGAG